MIARRLGLTLCLTAGFAMAAPAAPALANGAASTRNILLGAGLATYLIVNHNAKVHQKYAEKDRRQAETAAQRDDARQAYYSERSAYAHEAALVSEQQKEIAYQHSVVQQLQRQLAARSRSGNHAQHVSRATVHNANAHRTVHVAAARPTQPAPGRLAQATTSSYGWGKF